MRNYQHLPPDQIKARLDAGEKLRIIDVREADEFAICHIEGAELKPLSLFSEWAPELQGNTAPTVVLCHSGVRSQQACGVLAQQGVEGLINMLGGITQWAESCDPAMARY